VHYLPDYYEITGIDLEVLPVDLQQNVSGIYEELERSWDSVKLKAPHAIWSPRTGQWFAWKAKLATSPPPPPKPPWWEKMMQELARIDNEARLDPDEKERMKAEVRHRYNQ
jgi:hypothetical protein